MLQELTEAVVALAKAVEAGRKETERLCDLIQPITEKVLDSEDEGRVARAIMGPPKVGMMLRNDYAALKDAIENPPDAGKKISAIKAVRSATRSSLKDAKDLVDKYWDTLERRRNLLDMFDVGEAPSPV